MNENKQQERRDDSRGQALVEMTLIIPIILVVVFSVAELGVIFGKLSTLGYASREGARTGSALALGDVEECTFENRDPSRVDVNLVAAVQRILDSPDSGIEARDVNAVRIFSADSNGDPILNTTHIWTYRGEEVGPLVDPDADPEDQESIDYRVGTLASSWQACDRVNSGASPESIGVTVSYDHRWATPLLSFMDGFAGGGLDLKLTETTVMALNPTS